MTGQYTLFPANLPDVVQMNAGIIVDDFTPATGEIGNILGATGTGITFDSHPTFEDLGADIDNVPANTKQLKRLKGYDPVASGSFRTMTPALARQLAGAGTLDVSHIVPGHQLTTADFQDVWVIGDYANSADGAGYIAVHLKSALNTIGFKWKTTKDGKGEFDFEFHGHYDIDRPDAPPFEIYVRGGEA